jgi:hypothetical protein
MRINLSNGNPIMIACDYGGEPPYSGLSRTWFNRSLWDACGRSVKKRKALIAEVLRNEALNVTPAVRLGYVER